ncbi:nuclear transport factor 2 family protein [Flavobacterium sp.]|uniref:YybH family protein n=1 Tax=Flavobacterium sp. TaxID=239 RepID=UPI0026057B95|nr:nuclear transport factor 2 family protein [Flavobacterium sp.]
MIEKPSMKLWTDAWNEADALKFKNIYATDGVLFPPNKLLIKGNDAILEFMRAGLGKVEVVFEAEKVVRSENLVFEFGIFKDVEKEKNKTTGEGKYSVTWVLDNVTWKIQCHSWTMPIKF